ncbi:hypothetical protein [Streptomyces sp. NPDC059491]|uniref:hypothetical protein n=1 Tax=Streptomyces sp. NPDC059491 TaxID=3346850 RepID=UPI0036995787
MSSTSTIQYHYVLTLQRPLPRGGLDVTTWSATVDLVADVSRQEAYAEIRASIAQGDPGWVSANVLHWSLEPNALPAPGTPAAPWAPYVPPTQHPTGTPSAYLPQQRG